MSAKHNLLDGIRVIDLTRVLAGPYCTMLLGDMGADIIKIEAPERGDDTRQWGPPFTASGMSAYFISANRNKRSLTLNLKSSDGMSILKQMVADADVVVDNFKVGTLKKMGLSYAQMQALNNDIIYCTITGFGNSGPYSHRTGYDFIVQAMSGLMSLTGEIEGRPYRVGVAIADLLTGIYASNAITAALYSRERSGEGTLIDASLLDAQVATLSYVASNYLNSGKAPERLGNGHPNIVPYQDFEASDGFFAFASGNDLQWSKFCKAVGKEEWITDEQYASNPKRVQNREMLIPLLDVLFREKSVAEWLQICEQTGIPAAPINTIDQVFSDPQVKARDLVLEGKLSAGDKFRMAGGPFKLNGEGASIRIPPPALGEHSEDILGEMLGLSKKEIIKLKESGAI
jgi:crotonobetainyl-CoA:carnitine CoA-transferase CaiB-like acyl-CoA transferase